MRKGYIRAHHFLVSFTKQRSQIGWKKAMSIIVIMGAMFVGASGTALAMIPSAGNRLCQDVSTAEPPLEQSELMPASSAYLSTHIGQRSQFRTAVDAL